MKKMFLSLILNLLTIIQSFACAWGDDSDSNYYNLFAQEIINDPQYSLFLLTLESPYYSSKKIEKNENIEEWQSYLGLNYEDTEYLVFKASKEQIDKLIDKQGVTDDRLSFATTAWANKHHQALIYLSYAKYLEPYMIISIGDRDEWSYYYRDENTKNAGDLDYEEVIKVLKRGWETAKDKELKQRYGYQMVRLAHYTRRYAEAVDFFERYVDSISYCSAIHYYALNQLAGAERGLGNTDAANYLFFKVFSNTKNLKGNALNSIRLTSDVDYQRFLKQAKSANEINDAYLLLGYMSFSNPVAMAEEIAKNSPDAIQAKVLMARAINQLERNYNLTSSDNTMLYSEENRDKSLANKDEFFKQTLDFSLKMTKNKHAKEKNFWSLTSAYLHFLNKDFAAAKTYLAKVGEKDDLYKKQKEELFTYIYICEQPSITPVVEKILLEKYKRYIHADGFSSSILANRYYLQKEYAKSFLISNPITDLENYIEPELLKAIEDFVLKPDKSDFEKYILGYSSREYAAENSRIDLLQYINYLWGNYFLAQGDLQKSLEAFSKIQPNFKWMNNSYDTAKDNYRGFTGISDKIFDYNQIECFNCSPDDVMKKDYLGLFPFIKRTMNKKELVETLIQLQKIGGQDGETAAKANYLLGNCFYNASSTGYYWHILRFDYTNTSWSKRSSGSNKPDIYGDVYFKYDYYTMSYNDQADIANEYLTKAYEQTDNNELKARIAFALSKINRDASWKVGEYSSIEVSEKYFAELAKYEDTEFYGEVRTHCKYFEYYVNHIVKD